MDKVRNFLSSNGLMTTLFVLNTIVEYFTNIENHICDFFSNMAKAVEAAKIAEIAKAAYDAAVATVEAAEDAYEKTKKKYSSIDTFYWNNIYQNKEYRTLEKSLQGSKYYLKCQRDNISALQIGKPQSLSGVFCRPK